MKALHKEFFLWARNHNEHSNIYRHRHRWALSTRTDTILFIKKNENKWWKTVENANTRKKKRLQKPLNKIESVGEKDVI